MKQGDVLERYVERYFQRSGKTAWPTVRRCAKSLRMKQRDVTREAEDHDNLQLTFWNVDFEVRPGDRFVETITEPEVTT